MSSPHAPSDSGVRPRRRRKVAVGLVLVVAVVGAAALWAVDTDRAEGLRAARDGDFARAEPLLRRALARTPDDAEVVEALARGYLAAGDPQAATYLARWADLRPDQPEPLRLRLDFHRKRKQREEAYAVGRRLLDLQSNDDQLRRTVMNQAFSAGRFGEAEELCRACLQRQPGDTGLRLMLAEILRARGDPAGAAAVLDQLLREQPKLTAALFLRGVVHHEAGEPEKAVPLLRGVMAADPRRRAAAGYQLGLALERTGKADEARQAFAEVRRLQALDTCAEAVRTQPDNLAVRVRFAETLLADGHTADGLKLLTATLAVDPQFPPAHRVLAAHYEEHGEPGRAAEHRRLAGPTP